MPERTNSDEDQGQEIFSKMGLICAHRLNQVRLQEIDPNGSYSSGDHLEIDYLIPYDNICLVGEITSRSDQSDIRRKYNKFRRHFNILKEQNPNEYFWQRLGVNEEYLRDFRGIREFKGFFIVTELQKFDIDLSDDQHIVQFYKSDWMLLENYSQCIGHYAKYPFLQAFNIRFQRTRSSLTITRDTHNLLIIKDKRIVSGEEQLIDIFTFEVSPYELLPMARVYRRDQLPDLSQPDDKYQRPLRQKKLNEIRKNLLNDPDFIFPNSILIVLSNDCRFDVDTETLIIPEKYGAIEVIDGQHRLFSYADENVRRAMGSECTIIVTAIKFRDADEETIKRYSARTFIEINMKQTPISSSHLYAIKYPILKETDPKALAAQIILEANERRSKLYGLFDTYKTNLGIIQATTVLDSLKSITNIDYIKSLQSVRRGSRVAIRQGYENLFDTSINELINAETLIQHGTTCFEQYFNRVARIFFHDWPERGQFKNTSMEFAKMVAGFVKLLKQFIWEGCDWPEVQEELEKIRTNVLDLRGMREYNSILFDPSDPKIPDAKRSVNDNFQFLNLNREKPTSIQDIRLHSE